MQKGYSPVTPFDGFSDFFRTSAPLSGSIKTMFMADFQINSL